MQDKILMFKKQAFLLLDLMVAITIFFFAGSLTINLSYAIKKIDCICELLILKQTIQKAQIEALQKGIDQIISIDTAHNSYKVHDTATQLHSLLIGNESTEIPSLNNPKQKNGLCSFAQNKITCFKSGIISSGTIYFSVKSDKTLFFCLSCPVSQSNSIHIYEYKNKWTLCS